MIPKNYFNKLIMKITSSVLLVLLFLFLFFGSFSDWGVKVCCNEKTQCENPFYYCQEITLNNYNDCKRYEKFDCEGQEICTVQYIKPNSCITKEANWLNKNLFPLYLLILGMGLVINHYWYMVKVNKNENKN